MPEPTRPQIRRSLSPHAPLRRNPRYALDQLSAWLPADMLADGPEGPVAVLERRLAELLGKPAAMFFPTGAMAQQVALRLHADHRNLRSFAAHPANHLVIREEQGYAAVHGLTFRPVGDINQLMTTADLEAVAEPVGSVLWELPQRDIGGQLPTWAELVEQIGWARSVGAATHLDGARIWEAQTYYGRSLAEIADPFDTVYVSLYKALQAPRGAVLAGPTDLMAQAGVWRTRLGGTIPEAWPLAAAALMGLDRVLPQMPQFLQHAQELAAALIADGVAQVTPNPPQVPMFHVHLPASARAVELAHRDLVARTGIQLLLRVRTNPDPGRCSFEVSVGENTLDFTPTEVAALVRALVDDANARP